jgi:hypothetical protein
VSGPLGSEPRGDDEAPPFGGSWAALYAAVAGALALAIALLFAFTKAFE